MYAIVVHRAFELQLVERPGQLVPFGFQLDPGSSELFAESHKVQIPMAGDIRRQGERRQAQ